MRTAPPVLLPLLRSQVQGDVLAATYLSPEAEFSVTELARRAGVSVKAAAHEVARLLEAGLLADRRAGNLRLVRRGSDAARLPYRQSRLPPPLTPEALISLSVQETARASLAVASTRSGRDIARATP